MFNDFSKRFLSAIISAPISNIAMQTFQSPDSDEFNKTLFDHTFIEFIRSSYFFMLSSYLFIFPAFLIIGIPVSYLVDYVTHKIPFKGHLITYLIKFSLYFLFTTFVFLIVFDVFVLFDYKLFTTSLLPALVGFHVLFFLRKEFQYKGEIYSD